MIYSTRAIVLRTVKYGETSLIVDMFTEQKGHQTFIINSVRKAKAVTPPSYLQLFSLVEVVAYHKEHHPINRIKELRLDYTWKSIPFDMRKSAVITCLAEMCSKCMKMSDPHPELFSFLHEAMINYDDPDQYDRDFLIRFLVTLSQHLGFGIEIPSAKTDGKYLDLMEGRITMERPTHNYIMPMQDLQQLREIMDAGPHKTIDASYEVRRRLVDQLILYYQLHVESLKEVHSMKVLRELLS